MEPDKHFRTGNLVVAVLAGSWRTSNPAAPNLTMAGLDEVTPQLYASGGAALGWWRLRDTELSSTASGELLHQVYRLQALQAGIHEQHIKKVFRLLRGANVDPLLAKGWAAASLYPDQALRPYGDIDLLVRPEHFKTAAAVLETGIGSECSVDLHPQFSELTDRAVRDLFDRSRLMELEREQIRVLSREDHLALLAIHLLKHGACRPLWLCDIAAAIESLSEDFDWSICLGHNRKRAGWIKVAIGLARQLLGAEPKFREQGVDAEVPSWLLRSVLKQWSHLFPANHPPVQPLPLMASNLRSPWKTIKATWQRWPDPVTATINRNGRFDKFPRLPYQLGEFAARSFKFVLELPSKMDQVR